MIRPFGFESKRYGEPSTLSESLYDHPFQWGSKRTGPDLAREGNKYPNVWHYRHMLDPRSVSPGSNMPPYTHLATSEVDVARTAAKMHALQSIGVPYDDKAISAAASDADAQGSAIARNLADDGVAGVSARSEVVALVSYLQRLGTHPQPQRGPDVASLTP
jgi:cytochrome c oxidase cbb3-type subunit I/II